jgi:hypothetical protein
MELSKYAYFPSAFNGFYMQLHPFSTGDRVIGESATESHEQAVINLMNKFDKLIIADEMLETAIEAYLDDKKYFSALHLAGAAQEIYGKWLRIKGGTDFSTMMLDQAAKALSNDIDRKAIKKEDKRPKNSIKHIDNESDQFTYLNPKLDSFTMLSETVTEYLMLKRAETANIIRFKESMINTMKNGL